MRAIDSDFESKIPRTLNSGLLSETMDADQGGSDFVDTLPAPEIKTTEDLVAATAPAAPTPKPTDAMLRGKEMSQIQFEGMEPVYDTGHRGSQGDLLGYKFGMSQVQEPGTVASYSAPVYGPRGQLTDPGGKFLGYVPDYQKHDAPKSDEILALEKKFGTTMDPIYATYKTEGRGGQRDVEYGAPIGYRFDNGNSQYVSYDASGKYIGTQNREKPGAFGNVLMSVLSIAFPPIAPFVQAYNALKAIDEGNVLGFVISAVGAGKSIPGLDKSTISMLNDVATGAKIVQAVESKDPLKIFSSVVNLPNVDPDLKDLSIVVNTANAINKGDIAGAFNGISKMSDRDSIGRLTDRFNDIVAGQDVSALDPSQVAALTPATDEQAAQEQADRERAARDAVRTSEKTIEDTLTDAGLVTDTQDQATQEAERIAKEQADREQAALEDARAAEKAIADKEAADKVAADAKAAQDARDRQAEIDAANIEADKAAAETKTEEEALTPEPTSEKTIEQVLENAGLVAPEAESIPEPAPEPTTELEPVTVTEKAITDNELFLDTLAQEKADREQAARDAIRVSEKTIEDTLIEAGLVSNADDEKKLAGVEVTGKALTDTDLPITDDKVRNTITDSSMPVTGNTGNNRITDSSLPVNPNVGTATPTLERKEVTGKREIDTDLPITGDTGNNRITDSVLPVNPDVGGNKLAPVTVTGKRIEEEPTPDGGSLKPVEITGKRIVEEEPTPNGGELKPVTITGKKEEPVIPKIPATTPAKPNTPAKTTPAKTAKPAATPAEQLYQTITQSQPTTLADIKYYLDMASGGAVPPQTQHDPLESLLNQPMSVEELLHYLRS